MLSLRDMKAIILALIMSVSGVASANPTVAAAEPSSLPTLEHRELRALDALDQARAEVAATRQAWDRAVAGDHPIAAGKWAVRHFEAMQARKAAAARVEALAAAVRTPQVSSR
jgi:hypothetical protein